MPNGAATMDTPPPSAPESLITTLLELVAPHADGVWQETLVSTLLLLGHSAASARQAIARATREGALAASRVGRRAWLELSTEARDTLLALRQHEERDDLVQQRTWDVFIVRSPPMADAVRYRHRTQLLLSGLGYLGNGVWLGPSSPTRPMVAEALAADPATSVVVLRSEIAFPAAQDVVEQVWDLQALRRAYATLLTDFTDRAPTGPQEHLAAWLELSTRWRSCVRVDPGLPADALPADWPGDAVRRLVAEARRRWRPVAVQAFAALAPRGAPTPAELDEVR